MSIKSDNAFKTISEASALLDVPPHVLRFWESKFSTLRPLKRSGSRRYYRPDDLVILRRIRQLLYVDGFTIKGAQKLMRSKTFIEKTSMSQRSGELNARKLVSAMVMLDDVKIRLANLKQQLGS